MTSLEAIDALYEESGALTEYLANSGQTSFHVAFDTQFRKVLLMSAASRFEAQIRDALLACVAESANDNKAVIAFVKTKAIERQYHTYFKWDAANANQFFGLFGAEFKEAMVRITRGDPDLDDSIKAFLELGRMRNELVHLDFANFPLEKTVDEIFRLYQRASLFVTRLPSLLRSIEC